MIQKLWFRSWRNDPCSWLLAKQMSKIFASLSRSHFIQFQLSIGTVDGKYTKFGLKLDTMLLILIWLLTWLLCHVDSQDTQEYLDLIHNLVQYFLDLLSWNHPFGEYKSHQEWKWATDRWVLSRSKVQMLILTNEIPSRIDILNFNDVIPSKIQKKRYFQSWFMMVTGLICWWLFSVTNTLVSNIRHKHRCHDQFLFRFRSRSQGAKLSDFLIWDSGITLKITYLK